MASLRRLKDLIGTPGLLVIAALVSLGGSYGLNDVLTDTGGPSSPGTSYVRECSTSVKHTERIKLPGGSLVETVTRTTDRTEVKE